MTPSLEITSPWRAADSGAAGAFGARGNGAAPQPYPLAEMIAFGQLEVGDGHRIYWETAGNPNGIPVVYIHGGPGAGCGPSHRRFFDPTRYFIILVDQRGAGRSTPYAETACNTTGHLVADLEQLRQHLAIETWLLFGGSWGSTLALAYGQAHPSRVLGFVLRGVFLGSPREIDWFLNGMGRFRPDARVAFLGALPPAERADPLMHYYRRLCDPDPAIHGPAARAWARYEDACSHVGAALATPVSEDLDRQARALKRAAAPQGREPFLPLARLEAHYMTHDCFLAEGALLNGMAAIAHLPGRIVQGACDLVCPPEAAWAVHQVWPNSRLSLVADAGHSALEPGIQAGLLAATDEMAAMLRR
jgi:proline iminopeptidase